MNILFFAKYAKGNANNLPEDEVYWNYHQDIYKILKSTGNTIVPCNDFNELMLIKDIDYIFTLYNKADFRNSEIFVSEFAEYLRIPYLGARPNIRAISEDKCCAKMLSQYLNVPTPIWKKFDCGQAIYPESLSFKPPYFIKPRFGGSSKFISKDSIAMSYEQLKAQVKYLYQKNNDIIVEQYIEGTVYTVPLILNSKLEPVVLPPIKEESDCIVSTYLQKRQVQGGLKRSISNDTKINNLLKQAVLKIYEFIAPIDYARFDFIVCNGIPYFIEFNLCCNLGRKAAIALSASSSGIQYETMIKNIVANSIKRQKEVPGNTIAI